MKNRDFFLPSLSSLLIAGMISFLSCAHQNRVKDELDVQNDESGVESSESPTASTEEQPQNGDLSLEEDLKNSDTASNDSAANSTATDEKKLDDDLSLLNESNNSTTTENTTTTANNADELALESDLNNTPTETTAAVGSTKGDDLSLESDTSDLDVANGTVEGSTTGAGAVAKNDSPKTDELSVPPQESEPPKLEPKETAPILDNSSLSTETPVKSSGRSFSGSGHSRVPHIPAKAITRKGTKLNRFYFVRKGDTPSKVSELIYGSKDQAKQLTKWNGKSWKAGMVLYYASATEPKEKSMRSFYQERNISPEEYTVQKGDWLSRVATKRLGNSGSWKEIAVVNGMKKPDALEVGQKLAIYPLDLSGGSAPTNVAREEQQPETPKTVAQKQPEPVQPPQQQPAEITPPVVEPPVAQIPVEQPKVKKEAATNNFDLSKIIDQNMFFGVIGIAVLLLCAAYLMRKRKKAAKEAGDDFGEDGFQPPTKPKRK